MNEFLKLFEKNRPVLIMSLPDNDPALCRAAFEEGADVVKVHINVEHRASGTHFGRLAQEAVGARDTPLLIGIILVSAVVVVLVNLIVDIAYAALDPRVGAGEAQA